MKDYYTVSEYSKITGKDSSHIRRMLIYGKLLGEKLGNQWIIPKDAVYPTDSRLKSGAYKNYRQERQLYRTNPELMKSLRKMSRELSGIYGDSIDSIILYGSYARGEQTPESDVDIAVILKEDNDKVAHDKMIDVVVEYELNLGVTLSVVPLELNQYYEWKNNLPFYKNLDKEGIVLWKAA